MKLEVDFYSGRAADERLVRFRLDGNEYMVAEILDQWYGPSDTFFAGTSCEFGVNGQVTHQPKADSGN